MFQPFLLQLVAGAVVPLFLFSFFKTPLLGPVGLAASSGPATGSWLTLGTQGLRVLAQLYIWVGWAVYCGFIAMAYLSVEGVAYPGAYLLTAFVLVNGPIAVLSAAERGLAESGGERQALRRRTLQFRAVTSIGFVMFCLSPSLLASPYRWFVNDSMVRGTDQREHKEDITAHPVSPVRTGGASGSGAAALVTPSRRGSPTETTRQEAESASQLCTRGLRDAGDSQLDDAVLANACRSAAEDGDPRAAFHLATLYAEGRGVRRDAESARRWYQVTAENGITEAPTVEPLTK